MDTRPLILFDTDIGGDCDDAGALALLHVLCDAAEASLLAVTACYASPFVAGCIDAINTYYGRQVPVGILHAKSSLDPGVYAAALCREFPNRFPEGSEVPDSVTVLRRALADAPDGSVTFVVTGSMASAAALLASEPDASSPLSGNALIQAKIARTVVMGGRFFGTWPQPVIIGDPYLGNGYEVKAEFNIKSDIAGAQALCRDWPGELIFSSYEIGAFCVTLRDFAHYGLDDNPAVRAYRLHAVGKNGRESWDLTAMLDAVRPGAGYWNYHPYGKVSVDDSGVTRWSPCENGKHTYLLPRMDYDQVRDIIDNLIRTPAKCRTQTV